MHIQNREQIQPLAGDDGSIIHELASPLNSPITRHSLAEIRHPPGTSSREHYHTKAEEVYYVLAGQGEIRVDGETQPLRPGDIVTIIPGQRHKVWQRGDGVLTLLVTCIPPYSVDEVVFVE